MLLHNENANLQHESCLTIVDKKMHFSGYFSRTIVNHEDYFDAFSTELAFVCRAEQTRPASVGTRFPFQGHFKDELYFLDIYSSNFTTLLTIQEYNLIFFQNTVFSCDSQ